MILPVHTGSVAGGSHHSETAEITRLYYQITLVQLLEAVVQLPGRQPGFLVCLRFFLRFLRHFTLYFRNPVDATLALLSNFKNSRWLPAHHLNIQLNIIVLV